MTLERLAAALARRAPAALDLSALPAAHLPPGGFLAGAVLVPLLLLEGAPAVLLTRRPEGLRRHPGQWSFPGGRVEPGEEPLQAALREAEEEVGLRPADASLLGRLDETLVLASPFRLTPWVARVPYPYPFAAHPEEVERIAFLPLPALVAPGVHRTEVREAWGLRHEVHVYDCAGIRVWGATARILTQLLGAWRAA